jgi:hypothetical protein
LICTAIMALNNHHGVKKKLTVLVSIHAQDETYVLHKIYTFVW